MVKLGRSNYRSRESSFLKIRNRPRGMPERLDRLSHKQKGGQLHRKADPA